MYWYLHYQSTGADREMIVRCDVINCDYGYWIISQFHERTGEYGTRTNEAANHRDTANQLNGATSCVNSIFLPTLHRATSAVPNVTPVGPQTELPLYIRQRTRPHYFTTRAAMHVWGQSNFWGWFVCHCWHENYPLWTASYLASPCCKFFVSLRYGLSDVIINQRCALPDH